MRRCLQYNGVRPIPFERNPVATLSDSPGDAFISTPTMFSDDEVRARYGAHAIISRKDSFTLVHLDQPDPAQVQSRTEAFDSTEYFEENCPLCTLQRASGIYIFDEFPDDEEMILLE